MTPETQPIPLFKMLGIYLAVVLASMVLAWAIQILWPDFDIGTSLGTGTLIGGSMAAGLAAARKTGRLLTAKEKLVFGLLSSILGVAAVAVVLWAIFAYAGVPFTVMTVTTAVFGTLPDRQTFSILGWALLIGFGINVLLAFLFVGMGAKSHLKATARQASKGQ